MKTKIEKLTPEQEALLPVFRDKWLKTGLSTEPADRPRAEAAITEMYKILNRPKPLFIWAASPMTANLLINILSDKKLGKNIVGLAEGLAEGLAGGLAEGLAGGLAGGLAVGLAVGLET